MSYVGNIQFWSLPVGFPDFSNQGHWIDGFFNGSAVAYRGGPNDHLVLSVQPDGTYQTRPAGTQGGWETCSSANNLNVLTYNPDGVTYQIMYRAIL